MAGGKLPFKVSSSSSSSSSPPPLLRLLRLLLLLLRFSAAYQSHTCAYIRI